MSASNKTSSVNIEDIEVQSSPIECSMFWNLVIVVTGVLLPLAKLLAVALIVVWIRTPPNFTCDNLDEDVLTDESTFDASLSPEPITFRSLIRDGITCGIFCSALLGSFNAIYYLLYNPFKGDSLNKDAFGEAYFYAFVYQFLQYFIAIFTLNICNGLKLYMFVVAGVEFLFLVIIFNQLWNHADTAADKLKKSELEKKAGEGNSQAGNAVQ